MDTLRSTSDDMAARIMLVDDHPNTASMLARALGDFHVPVKTLIATSAEEAIAQLGEEEIDVLITDFILPGKNGLELIEQLQRRRRSLNTILITAYDTPGLAMTARRLSVDHYFVKPVQPEKVRAAVVDFLRGWRGLEQPRAEVSALRQLKILVADDRPDNRRLLTTRLHSEGYIFVTAEDGEEALRMLRSESPDLLLLDLDMPKKNGFDVLAEMRADPETAFIPVIVITSAYVEPEDIRKGLSLGADDYVTKPFDWHELAARVRTRLRVKQAEDALRRRNQELELLPEIGQHLSAHLGLEALARVVLEQSVRAFTASMGHLAIFNPDGRRSIEAHFTGDEMLVAQDDERGGHSLDGLLAVVVADRQGVILDDTEADGRALQAFGAAVRSAICVPLLGRRNVIGALSLFHQDPGFFKAEHLSLLQAIATQASIAIESAQVHTIEQKRISELTALNHLAREIGLITSSVKLFDEIPRRVQEALGYPVVSLWLKEGDELTLRRQAGATGGASPGSLARAVEQVDVTGQPRIVSGVPDPTRAKAARRASRRRPSDPSESYSSVAVPLIWNAKISGVLAIHSPQANAFQEGDRVVLEMLAGQVATALDRIRLFESVAQEQRRLAAVLRAAAGAILLIDREGRLQLLNPAGQRLFTDVGTKLGQPLPAGRGYDDLIELLGRALYSKSPEQEEIDWPDGRIFAAYVTPIEDGGQVAVLQDVTHFKDLERVKDEFIAATSHDLKNPITTVIGFSNLLGKVGPLNEQQADFLTRIELAARHMNELVLNLLELARIDMGVALRSAPVDLSELTSRVIEDFRSQAKAKGQTLAVTTATERVEIRGDGIRLQQVLGNLVSNAIKYTPSGGEIDVTTAVEGGYVWVHVQDNGIGIPAEDLPFIFDKFYRVQSEETQDVQGNGLGLAIVRSVVEQHGGQVSAESKPGQGSRFSIRLPVSPMAQASEA